ncbi:MAG: energy transducer TonB [Crocinitomicaceae bacterium]|nr:energy transducer TonB [Crocinitomicaceae bacterium]
MIAKKSKKADLERKRFAFFQIGLLVAGSLCLAAFEYASPIDNHKTAQIDFGADDNTFYEDPIFDVVEEEPEKVVESNPVVFTLDTDTLLEIEEDPVKVIVSTGKIKVDPDATFDPFADIDLTIGTPVDPIIEVPDKDPSFIGGLEAMYEWIGNNVEYPAIQQEMGLGGTAYVSFVVEKDGSISSVKTLNEDDGVDQAFLNEGKRVVRAMPKWIPGENMGKTVRVRFMIPIKFTTE